MPNWKLGTLDRWIKRKKVKGVAPEVYSHKLEIEKERFRTDLDVHELPPIFHYWSNKYVAPLLGEYGVTQAVELYAHFLRISARNCGNPNPVFLSIGAGNCDLEIRLASQLKEAGLQRFVIECLELNPDMLQRGRTQATEAGLTGELSFVQGDFNLWKANRGYEAVIAHHSLHHVMNLERLFDRIKKSLLHGGYFLTNDIIGRNGHLRWPEALDAVQRFWRELPVEYRWNRPLHRYEDEFLDFDCSKEGFEGIRAQDILPLLLKRFDFHLFIPFANVIDVFVGRAFGHNFNTTGAWDRRFIDRVQEFDEQGLLSGALTPTQMFAAMTPEPCKQHNYSRGIEPSRCVRNPSRHYMVNPAVLRITTPSLQSGPQGPPRKDETANNRVSGWSVLLPVQVNVTDSSNPSRTATQRFTLHLWEVPSFSGYAENSRIETPFRRLTATGGVPPYKWSLAEETLLPGLSLDEDSGIVSYAPRRNPPANGLQPTAESPVLPVKCGVIPHIAAGGNWSTAIYLLNISVYDVSVGVRFWSDDGSPLKIPICSRSGTRDLFALNEVIPPCGSLLSVTKIDTGPHETGWAEVTASDWIIGYTLYHYVSPNGVHAEHAMPFSQGERSISIVYDNRTGTETGVAIANLSAEPAYLIATLLAEDGNQLAFQTFRLGVLGHMSFLLRERFPTAAGNRGILVIRNQGRALISGLAMAFPSEGGFRPLPILAGPTVPPDAT